MCEQVAVWAQVISSTTASSSIECQKWVNIAKGREEPLRKHAGAGTALTATFKVHVGMDSVAMPADATRGSTLTIALGGMHQKSMTSMKSKCAHRAHRGARISTPGHQAQSTHIRIRGQLQGKKVGEQKHCQCNMQSRSP